MVRHENVGYSTSVLRTSHYMDDVSELCPRVLVIDHGRVIFDGALGELVQRIRPDKRVQLRLSRPVQRRDLEPLGTIVEFGEEAVVLQVSHDQLQSSVQRALAQLPLRD